MIEVSIFIDKVLDSLPEHISMEKQDLQQIMELTHDIMLEKMARDMLADRMPIPDPEIP